MNRSLSVILRGRLSILKGDYLGYHLNLPRKEARIQIENTSALTPTSHVCYVICVYILYWHTEIWVTKDDRKGFYDGQMLVDYIFRLIGILHSYYTSIAL